MRNLATLRKTIRLLRSQGNPEERTKLFIAQRIRFNLSSRKLHRILAKEIPPL